MGESSVLWLRVAAALYAVGLIDAIVTILRQRETFFRFAAATVAAGAMLHFVSIVDQTVAAGHFPANDVFGTISFCAWIVASTFLLIRWRYQREAESLSVFIFPLIFVMTLMAALQGPESGQGATWSSDTARSTWLVIHIVASLMGYAALLFASIASVLYLAVEKQLKRKVVPPLYQLLPPLGTLDEFISRSLGTGFVFITIGIIIASIWAFIEHGTHWIGNSSIAISFLTWGIYLLLICFRVSAGWRGRKAAFLSIAALCFCAITWAAHAGLQNRLTQ